MLHDVGTAQRRIDDATRRTRQSIAALGTDIRRARLAAGLSQARVGTAAGISHSHVSRIESGRYEPVRFIDLARVASVVGLDVSLRAYPGPDPLRDVAHIRLLERLRARVSRTLTWRAEVPVGRPGDQRSWDAVIAGAGPPIAVEAETRIVDLQLVERRLGLKRRDSGMNRVVLLLSNTRWNRQALDIAGELFGESFPVTGADALVALSAGRDPGGSAVVLL